MLISPRKIALLTLSLAVPAAAQTRMVVRPALPYQHDAETMAPDRVVLKFREGIAVRLVDGGFRARPATDLAAVTAALGGAPVRPLFTRPVAELDTERAALQARVPPGQSPLADLNNYFVATTSGVAATERLVPALLALAVVETAYAEPLPFLAGGDIPPTTPQFRGQQGHLGAAPGAFGFDNAEHVVGARLPDGAMAHLEGGWVLDHEDCDWLMSPQILGSPPSGGYTTQSWTEHGTACVGLMAALRNGYGAEGFGSGCRALYLVSLSSGGANQISLATAPLGAGDVMSSSFVYVLSGRHAPRDHPQADYDAVRIAATKGIHYTFSAGNTANDLENQSIYGSRYLPGSLSSGGFIIGMTDPGASSRNSLSCYGATHVIANGWGSSVTTLGYGGLFNGGGDPRQHYTDTFGGTSAAAPQVAGVVGAYTGIVREQLGVVLTVAEVKADLLATGTAISGSIGNRPDLNQLLALRGLPDGLSVAGDAALGGSVQAAVAGNAGEAFALFLALGRGNTAVGGNRPLLLDGASLVLVTSGTVPAGGSAGLSLPVPNDPALSGLDVFLQAALARGAAPHLTNSVTAAVL